MIANTHVSMQGQSNIGTQVRTREATARKRVRREQVWAWLSLVTLILCWDACMRLDHRVSMPRPRLAHAVEREQELREDFSER